MLDWIAKKILLRLIGQYVEGLETENIDFGVQGRLKIENLRIKSKVIDWLEWPVELRYSVIKQFILNVPWASLSE
jgi:hypothetical protein